MMQLEKTSLLSKNGIEKRRQQKAISGARGTKTRKKAGTRSSGGRSAVWPDYGLTSVAATGCGAVTLSNGKKAPMKTKHWILLSAGAAIGAALAWWLLKEKNNKDEKPPKNAPQTPINNPVDQSEFQTSPGASSIG